MLIYVLIGLLYASHEAKDVLEKLSKDRELTAFDVKFVFIFSLFGLAAFWPLALLSDLINRRSKT